MFGRAIEQARHGDDLLLFAAALGFYALVSVIPLVVMILWIISLVLGEDRVRQFAQQVKDLAPEDIGAGDLVISVTEKGSRLGLTAALVALWPATSYGSGLTRAFDRLSPRPDRELEGLRGRGLALVALLPLLIVGTLAATFVGSQAVGESGLARIAGAVIALAAAFFMAASAVAMVYWIFPQEPLSPRSILEGALVTATGISVISLGLVLYFSLGADLPRRYVPSGLAAVVLLSLWLYLSNALMLLGYKVAASR